MTIRGVVPKLSMISAYGLARLWKLQRMSTPYLDQSPLISLPTTKYFIGLCIIMPSAYERIEVTILTEQGDNRHNDTRVHETLYTL